MQKIPQMKCFNFVIYYYDRYFCFKYEKKKEKLGYFYFGEILEYI